MALDWKRAIEINREALLGIVAGLVAWLSAFEGVLRLPRGVYQSVGVSLHKAESAVRRLIVIAARGLVVPLLPKRPMPEGLVIISNNLSGPSRRAFPLFDARINYGFEEADASSNTSSFVRYMDDASLYAKFPNLLGQLALAPTNEAPIFSSAVETKLLHLRLAAAERALQNLTAQAKRMARWCARREMLENPKFTCALRPGPPPGINKASKANIDVVLRECHDLAYDALKLNSS